MCGASSTLEQAGDGLCRTDLDHPFDRMEIDSKIQGGRANDPFQGSFLDPAFNCFSIGTVDGTVMQGQLIVHLRTSFFKRLIPAFTLRTGVGENQGRGLTVQAFKEFGKHRQTQMPCPRKTVERIRDQGLDSGFSIYFGSDDFCFSMGPRTTGCGFIEVADGRRKHPGSQTGNQKPEMSKAEFGLAPAFASHQFMPLIHHNALEVGKKCS